MIPYLKRRARAARRAQAGYRLGIVPSPSALLQGLYLDIAPNSFGRLNRPSVAAGLPAPPDDQFAHAVPGIFPAQARAPSR